MACVRDLCFPAKNQPRVLCPFSARNCRPCKTQHNLAKTFTNVFLPASELWATPAAAAAAKQHTHAPLIGWLLNPHCCSHFKGRQPSPGEVEEVPWQQSWEGAGIRHGGCLQGPRQHSPPPPQRVMCLLCAKASANFCHGKKIHIFLHILVFIALFLISLIS